MSDVLEVSDLVVVLPVRGIVVLWVLELGFHVVVVVVVTVALLLLRVLLLVLLVVVEVPFLYIEPSPANVQCNSEVGVIELNNDGVGSHQLVGCDGEQLSPHGDVIFGVGRKKTSFDVVEARRGGGCSSAAEGNMVRSLRDVHGRVRRGDRDGADEDVVLVEHPARDLQDITREDCMRSGIATTISLHPYIQSRICDLCLVRHEPCIFKLHRLRIHSLSLSLPLNTEKLVEFASVGGRVYGQRDPKLMLAHRQVCTGEVGRDEGVVRHQDVQADEASDKDLSPPLDAEDDAGAEADGKLDYLPSRARRRMGNGNWFNQYENGGWKYG
ncbi:hypothetical protein FIBSPDRAFT_903932 [Athelia psychrophila]|uniref:Uncharacterized protein n=1 Tax=Athelia psychrophila TaxID=1759441 RepID=A0A167VDJ3_9AGAM|nr:hypothetical protein FIBSPDRAFT_903932 [Fibularhizoctonia sp. CBS 109695]